MTRNTYAVMFLAAAIGLAASGCGGSDSKTAATSSTAAASATNAGQLPSLIPTPANTQTTKGPDSLPDNGIHLYFQVTGSPAEVMKAYKAALEAKKWDVTNVVTSDGGATYTGTNGAAYNVVDGGGWQDKTYIDVCAWPTKPADPNCKRSDR
ncbi:hypothetical protein [Mycobacterium sp. DL592]|uniref:hypothetical protein n=1 Tax=Mycobacterium sp. DL592 TaxID=2675524 RepID=UPI001420DD7A|nr:hypothetical protein [Mycobacterium sp. DL592]